MTGRAKAKAGTKRGAVKKKVAPKKASAVRAKKTTSSKAKTASKVSAAKGAAAERTRTQAGQKKTGGTAKKTLARVSSKETVKVRPASKAKKSGKAPSRRSSKRGAPKRSASISSSRSRPIQPAASEQDTQAPQEPALPKTYLSDEELLTFRDLLLDRRRELAGDVTNLSHEVINRKAQAGSAHSAMPIHMADLGTDNWEQEFTLGLIANERDRIRDIDEALARIDNKTYGICLATHKRISRARLRAKPWAKYCIEYARAREEGRAG